MTKFEAYIQDLIVSVSQDRPTLISLPENAKEEDVKNKVASLISNKPIDTLGEQSLEKMLNLPFLSICAAAATSPKELDRAKAIRNIHIHNRGFVNLRNRERIGNVEIGDFYPVTWEYIKDLKEKIRFVCFGLDKAVITLYPETVVS